MYLYNILYIALFERGTRGPLCVQDAPDEKGCIAT